MGRRTAREDESEDLPAALWIINLILREESMLLKQTLAGLLCGLGLTTFAQVSQFSDLSIFVGSGSDTVGVVIDFLDSTQQSSFAWGVLFNDSIDGQGVIDALSADPALSFSVTNGFLNDLVYSTKSLAGIGGSPDYWGTWSGNPSAWVSNLGLTTSVPAGTWFGFSYMDFNPSIEPGPAVAAENSIGTVENEWLAVSIYPVPFSNLLNVQLDSPANVRVYNALGQLVAEHRASGLVEMDALSWPKGLYSVVVEFASGEQVYKVIK